MSGQQPQPDGSYPRLTFEQVQSGQYNGMICSLVGKIQSHDVAQQMVSLECCDGGIVAMDTSQIDLPESIMNLGTGGGGGGEVTISMGGGEGGLEIAWGLENGFGADSIDSPEGISFA